MFQIDWDLNISDVREDDIRYNKQNGLDCHKIQFTFWAEHCLECSAPKCFKSCNYYEKRIDGRCKRTESGQHLMENNRSLFNVASRFKFRPWSKIETYVYSALYSTDELKKIIYDYSKKALKNRKMFCNFKCLLNNLEYYRITRSKNRTQNCTDCDVFLFELESYFDKEFKMIIESADKDWKVISRKSVLVKPGFNSFKIEYNSIVPNNSNVVRFYPENNLTPEVLVVNAEFIKLKKKSSKFVKCVAWDLDNTLWDGILSETNDFKSLILRATVIDTIKELDRRGILQTIVSKNDEEPAFEALKYFGIFDYFLYPAINWNRKSQNLLSIAKELNINIDSFLVIDDSAFEREEISTSIPQIRVCDEHTNILALEECNVPVTKDASERRKMYQIEAKRKVVQKSFGDNDYISFLKSCNIKLNLGFLDSNSSECERCFELLNRTNQLNISGNKYSEQEFKNNVLKETCLFFNASDKFGEYGIVGFISLKTELNTIFVNEFAVSCRIARKHIEHAILYKLSLIYKDFEHIVVKFVKTEKNSPMFNCLKEIGFKYFNNDLVIDAKELIDEKIVNVELK